MELGYTRVIELSNPCCERYQEGPVLGNWQQVPSLG